MSLVVNVVVDRVLHTEELVGFKRHARYANARLWIHNRKNHTRQVLEVEHDHSLSHEIEPVNFVTFCVNNLALTVGFWPQMSCNPGGKSSVTDVVKKWKL